MEPPLKKQRKVKSDEARRQRHLSIKLARKRLRRWQKDFSDENYDFDIDIPFPTAEERQRLFEMPQNGPDWSLERKKRLGASHASCRVGHGNATIVDHWRLETGRITWEPDEKAKEMFAYGHLMEPKAAEFYVKLTKRTDVKVVGLMIHPTVAWLHASPDRLVGSEGLLEIKCPFFKHIPREIPLKHIDQMMQQMAVAQRRWCDYLVYVSPEKYGLWRLEFSEEYWGNMMKYLNVYAKCLHEDICPEPTMLKLRQDLGKVKSTIYLI